MIKNALSKARPGVCRVFLHGFPVRAAALERPSLTSARYRITKLNHPLSTSLQRQFSNVPGPTSLGHDNDTIYALSTAPGRAAIAIFRISGSGWQDVRGPFPQISTKLIVCSRYTAHYARMNPFPHLDVPRYESYTTLPTQATFSTQLSFSTSQHRRLSLERISWNYIYTEDMRL